MNKASETIGKYSRIADNICNCDSIADVKSLLLQQANGGDISQIKLPKATKVFDRNMYTKL